MKESLPPKPSDWHPIYAADKFIWLGLVMIEIVAIAASFSNSIMPRIIAILSAQLATAMFTLMCHGNHVRQKRDSMKESEPETKTHAAQ